MAMASLRPNVVDFMHSTSLGEGGLTIEEMMVPDNSRYVGKTLVETNLKQDYGVTVIGIKKAGQDMNIGPGPSTVLQAKDILVVLGPNEKLEAFSKVLT
jgi:K+/H+ antiporter YhaU regulatory subunit KhtT